jgi:mRNA-degrading endonuclease RelE of RelBE toxin-antitoxin system
MDKTEKLLKKLSEKDFIVIQNTLEKILTQNTEALDIKKLSGQSDIFRVRVGTLRIIFLKKKDDIEVLEISRRSGKTYKSY